MLLAIREIKGEHTGYNISLPIFEVAKKYNIVDRLGYFMIDGAGNNNTTVRHLNRRVREAGGVGFNPEERRLWCLLKWGYRFFL